jgi:hypothetical protein
MDFTWRTTAGERLWVNRNGKFGSGVLMGAAVSGLGDPRRAWDRPRRYRRRFDLDLFLTHLINDYNTLYVNNGNAASRTRARPPVS